MKNLIPFLFLFMQLTTSPAFSWEHRYLESNDLVKINVDYDTYKVYVEYGGCTHYANHTWFNVTFPSLKSDDKVRVVLVNKHEEAKSPYGIVVPAESKTYTVDLWYDKDSNRFTGELAEAFQIYVCGSMGSPSYTYTQELALVINGSWYKEPKSGNNFKFIMYPF